MMKNKDNFLPDCPFCSKKKDEFFLEDDRFAAICSISPILPGHSLVIPKRHCESIFDLLEEELPGFMQMGRKAAKLLGKVINTESFNWFIQEKEPAGQSVPHLHMHVVPRIMGDLNKPGDWYTEIYKSIMEKEGFQIPKDQLLDITQRLKVKAGQMKIL